MKATTTIRKKPCFSQKIVHDAQYKRVDRTAYARSMGAESGNWIGFGFMNKPGVTDDETNAQFLFFSLVYVIRGKGTYVDDKGRSYALQAGSIFQRCPDMVHTTRIDPDSDWREGYIDFDQEFYRYLVAMKVLEGDTAVYQLTPDSTIETYITDMMKALEQSSESNLPDLLVKTLTFIRSLINRANLSQEDLHLSHMVEKSCLDFSQLFNQRIDLKAYCKANGWGYETFRKAFQNKLGIPPGKYLVKRRMDEACQLLRSTNKSVSEIAIELGYKSPYEFSSQFKQQMHVAPSHFRTGKPL